MRLKPAAEAAAVSLAWTPDGKRLAIGRSRLDRGKDRARWPYRTLGEIEEWSLFPQIHLRTRKIEGQPRELAYSADGTLLWVASSHGWILRFRGEQDRPEEFWQASPLLSVAFSCGARSALVGEHGTLAHRSLDGK